MTQATASTILRRSAEDPIWFFRHVLGVDYLTPQQFGVVASIGPHKRTAVTAGHAVGKTWLAARLALWFLYTHPGSKVITTAPTWTQVAGLLWRELGNAHLKSRFPLGGRVNQTELNLAADWFAIGLSTNTATRIQGFHAPSVMVIFDEATGVASDIWQAAESLVVGPDDRWLAIGNPTDPTSSFKQACDGGLWNLLELSSEDHPNVLEGRMVVPGAVTGDWVAEREIEYGGRDSGLYRSHVRGLWPEAGEDSLISMRVVEDAIAKWTSAAVVGEPHAVGCDVARFGADETVLAPIYASGAVGQFIARRGQDTMATSGQLQQFKTRLLGVDDVGVGGGVTDRLKELKRNVIPVNAGAGAIDEKRFVNLRAEMWWALRDALKAGDLSLPKDDKLKADLTNVKFSYDSRGRVRLESKDDIKKRLGRSPDRGDALAIANWVRVPRGPSRTIIGF